MRSIPSLSLLFGLALYAVGAFAVPSKSPAVYKAAASTAASPAPSGTKSGAKPGASSASTAAPDKAAVEKANSSVEHIQKANALIRQGNIAGAEAELIEADRLTPDYCPILQQLSTLQLRRGDPDAAIATLERAIRRGKGFDDHTYLLAARIFSQKKQFVEGERKLVQWGGDRPVTANFHAAIGILKMGAMELGPAEIELREALKLDPGNEAALTGMSQLYGRVDQRAKLQPFLDKGLAAKPESVPILMLAGNNLLQQERYAEAKTRFDTLIKLDPANAAAWVNLGSCLHGMGDTAGAIRCFRKASELDPKSVEAPINLALALERESKPAEAREVLLAARKRSPENLDFLNALAMAYHLNGQLDEAIAAIKDSLARDPNQPPMKNLLQRIESEKSSGKPAGN